MWRAGKSNRDQETASGAGCGVDGPVVCPDDAVHDGQPEADPDVFVGAGAFCSASKGFGESRYQFRKERRTGVLDPQHARVVLRFGVDGYGAAGGEIVDDGVLDEVGHHPQDERRGAEGLCLLTGDVEHDPALFGEGQQRFGGLLGDEGQVDGLAGKALAVGAAEQQQGLGEVDRPRVDGAESFDEFAPVPRGVVVGEVKECLRDRQRGAQFVGGVRGESLLFGDVGFELFEHEVEHVGEFAEFVLGAWHADPVGQ